MNRPKSLSLRALLVSALLAPGYFSGCGGDVGSMTNTADEQQVDCGPRALHIALQRLGIPADSAEIHSNCELTPSGVEFGELKRVAEQLQVDGQLERVSWNELTQWDGVCVLLVNDNHYVAADPRQSAEHPNQVCLLDPDDAARYVDQQELEAAWSGESLLLQRNPPAALTSVDGARIRWQVCWDDIGYCFAGQRHAEYSFRFENVGPDTLRVEVAGKSCDCTGAELSATELAPGEAGECRARVSLYGKRGRFNEHLFVKSNDPDVPQTCLTLAGAVYLDDILSRETLYFGEVVQGETIQQRLVVHDPGRRDLVVRGAHYLPEDRTEAGRSVDDIVCDTAITRVERDSPLIGDIQTGRYVVQEGDYVIEAMLRVSPDAAVGPVRGTLELETSLPEHLSRLPVAVDATVRSDLEATPRAILLSDSPTGKPVTSLQLRRRSGRPCGLSEIHVRGCSAISVVQPETSRDATRLRFEVRCDFVQLTDSLSEAVIDFNTTDGSVCSVPVVVRSTRKASL